MPSSGLIFDIGCHRGDDAAYYLAKGFNVLAIEANPTLYEQCRRRFAREIATGQAHVLNGCVLDVQEDVQFFVNANDGWSSVVQGIGQRGGAFQQITLRSVPLDELVHDFGVPRFLKIDVEGAEPRLIQALQRCARPHTLALEIDFYEGDPVADLEALGYRRFRIIRQPHLVSDPELPSWEFTRCSSGPLHADLLEGQPQSGFGTAHVARAALAAIRQQSYRWHDLYAVQ